MVNWILQQGGSAALTAETGKDVKLKASGEGLVARSFKKPGPGRTITLAWRASSPSVLPALDAMPRENVASASSVSKSSRDSLPLASVAMQTSAAGTPFFTMPLDWQRRPAMVWLPLSMVLTSGAAPSPAAGGESAPPMRCSIMRRCSGGRLASMPDM